MKSFKELLLWLESGYGNKSAIVDLDRNTRWTYADLNRAARAICAAYAEAGLVKNDRVGWLAMAPGADVTALSIGARKMGAIPVVMNARASVERLAWMIDNIGIKVLAYTAETAELLGRVQAVGIPSVELFIALDAPVSAGHRSLASIYEQHADAVEPTVEIAPDDEAFVIYTSGSTGRPKPIVHTEATYLETSMNMAYAWAMTHDDRFLSIMPPHFAGWLGVTTAVLRAAASQICVRFDPMKVARAIADERCSHAVMSPTMVRILRGAHEADPALFEGNDMRAGMLGGEVITPDVMDILFRMFPKFQLMGSLGATEAAIAHTGVGHPRVKTDDGRLVGRPMPGVFVELRDPESGEVITEPNRSGEMFVRGPVAKGVWGDPEATEANFPGGWWRSKDLLYRDDEGFLYFAGRADNLFKSGGIKVSCEDVESVLKAHPLVLDAIVVPVPDERLGSVAHAFVRHREGLDAATLEAWWRERPDAEPYARPRHWKLMGVEPFPMVTALKVDRSSLRARAVQEVSK
jgi:acyl-coenzyme A synthetase/AMP-(fatty) acid ligase